MSELPKPRAFRQHVRRVYPSGETRGNGKQKDIYDRCNMLMFPFSISTRPIKSGVKITAEINTILSDKFIVFPL